MLLQVAGLTTCTPRHSRSSRSFNPLSSLPQAKVSQVGQAASPEPCPQPSSHLLHYLNTSLRKNQGGELVFTWAHPYPPSRWCLMGHTTAAKQQQGWPLSLVPQSWYQGPQVAGHGLQWTQEHVSLIHLCYKNREMS